jgi:hypothetical protein
MGYTQYYYRKEIEHPQEVWDKFLADVKTVASKFKLRTSNSLQLIKGEKLSGSGEVDVTICDGHGEGLMPEFSKEKIWFNGFGDDSHETLVILQDYSPLLKGVDAFYTYKQEMWEKEGEIFECCKTAAKPYDILVTATLALYKFHFQDKVKVSGDGDVGGFASGIGLVNRYLDYNLVANELHYVDVDGETQDQEIGIVNQGPGETTPTDIQLPYTPRKS